MTLDGLERRLREVFKKASRKNQPHPKVNLVRYADDFVITGNSKELLEDRVQPLVETFLRERGLELSPEKTRITQVAEGFDFLGQNHRKYRGKFLSRPSLKNRRAFMQKIRRLVELHRGSSQSVLIERLNPVMRGWSRYHRHASASRVFCRMDFEIWRTLWRWARRRHQGKAASWIMARYWRTVGRNRWTFCCEAPESASSEKPKLLTLVLARHTRIVRHCKIKSEAHPFDRAWRDYFALRKQRTVPSRGQPSPASRGMETGPDLWGF